MRYAEILSRFYAEPLAMLPSKILAVKRFLDLKARGEDVPPEEVAAIMAARRHGPSAPGNVAVIPVMGVLSQRVSGIEKCSGGIGCDEIGASIDAAVRNPEVKALVLAFDSPGGSVFGVAELADRIRSARTQKRCYGIADSMAASAAYWLLAQCSEAWCAPGGQVGSIGVYCAHEDLSKAEEMEGVKTTLVSAGRYKVEGNPYEPLSEDARQEMQSKVDAYYGAFVSDVGKGRGVLPATVSKEFGQGRMLLADAAKKCGMVDRVGTLAELLGQLGGRAVRVRADGYGDNDDLTLKAPRTVTAVEARARAVEVEQD